MRNRTLLIAGVVCLALGLTPAMPIPIILSIYLAHAGGALVILAALRFLFALALGWPIATVAAGAVGVAQYFAVAALEPGATHFLRRMFLSWSEMVSYCGGALVLSAAIYALRDWKRRRDAAAWQAAAPRGRLAGAAVTRRSF